MEVPETTSYPLLDCNNPYKAMNEMNQIFLTHQAYIRTKVINFWSRLRIWHNLSNKYDILNQITMLLSHMKWFGHCTKACASEELAITTSVSKTLPTLELDPQHESTMGVNSLE
jgi:hypothetical protein